MILLSPGLLCGSALCVSVRVGGIGCVSAPTSMLSCTGFPDCYFFPEHTSESEFVCVTAAQQPAGQGPTSLCVLWLLCRFPCGGVSESKRLNEPLIERMAPCNNFFLFLPWLYLKYLPIFISTAMGFSGSVFTYINAYILLFIGTCHTAFHIFNMCASNINLNNRW